MTRIMDLIGKVNLYIGIFTFLAMCAVILLQVVARYVFNNALPWPEELGRYLFLICSYSCCCYCSQKNAHLRVEMLPVALKNQAKAFDILSLLTTAIFWGISIYMIWQMLRRVYRMGNDAMTMPVPMWTIWAIMLGLIAFSLLFTLFNLYERILNKGGNQTDMDVVMETVQPELNENEEEKTR